MRASGCSIINLWLSEPWNSLGEGPCIDEGDVAEKVCLFRKRDALCIMHMQMMLADDDDVVESLYVLGTPSMV